MKPSNRRGILLAILAAALYAISTPFSKLLLDAIPSTLLAGLLYLGAGLGMAVIALTRRIRRTPQTSAPFSRSDTPFVLLMIGLDIAAPILLLLGLSTSSAASASLLGNFEIVATALTACGVGSSSSPCPALSSPSRT